MSLKKRTRMSPAARRSQLLDSAKYLIQSQGLSNFTMDALALEAKVSTPLVFKYFDTRLALLQELLAREYVRYSSNIRHRISEVASFEELISIFVHLNFEEASQGGVVDVLRAQPDIRLVIRKTEQEALRSVGKELSKNLREIYHLKPSHAEQLVVLGSGASQAAAFHYARFGGQRRVFIDRAIAFIITGINGLAD